VFSLPQMIDTLRPKYEEAKKRVAANSTAAVKRGVGVAIGVYGSGLDGPDTAETDVELNADGTVTIFNAWEDHGQGADMGTLATAHEALRPLALAPEQIRLVMNDTSKCPNSGPAGGSRSQVVVGQSIRVGCEELIKSMRKANGAFRTYEEMVAENIPTKVNGKWSAPAKDCDANGQGSPFCCYMYGLFMSEVAVEVATGKTTVESMVCVADIGKVVNRLVVDGQIYGGMAQGIGLALTEDFEDIKKHSTLAGAGFPYIKQIPDNMEIIYIETPRPDGPFGASGVGEMPLTSPHAAVINAIYNACGARVRHLPALPEKVLAAMPK
jgi:aldehyde oxidoreductase